MGRDELQPASGTWKDNGGVSTETGGSREAQEASAGIGVVGSGNQLGERRDRSKQEIELAKELFMLRAKGCVTLPELLDFIVAQGSAPFETCGNNGIELHEEARVELSSFVGLEGRVDIPGFGPERWIEGLKLGRGAMDAVLPDFHRAKNFGLAAFEHRSSEYADVEI